MDSELVQRTRYLLQTRVRTAKCCPVELLPIACGQLLHWLQGHPVLGVLIAQIRARESYLETQQVLAASLAAWEKHRQCETVGSVSLDEHAVICLAAVELVAGLEDIHQERYRLQGLAGAISHSVEGELADTVELVRDVAIDGLFIHLDERLDSRNMFLALLRKYKQRCEWFRRSRLRAAAGEGLEGETGERALALDLHEYIHDQGVDFHVEPASPSGRADVLAGEVGGELVVVEAKYFRSGDGMSRIQRRLAEGLHQTVIYCSDHHQPLGFMVLFNETPFVLDLPHEVDDGQPCIRLNEKSIYFVEVRIYEGPSASKAGAAKVLRIARDDLELGAQDAPET